MRGRARLASKPGMNDGTGVPISSYHSIKSTFAESSPHVGIYDDAYDIFVNSNMIIGPGTTEIMIWVDNYEQTPAGTKFATAVGLDYFGIDCTVLDDGTLFVFEADAAMLVHGFDPDPVKLAGYQRIRGALDALLTARAG